MEMTVGRSQLLIRIWTPNKELIGNKQDEKKCHGERAGKKNTRNNKTALPLFFFLFFSTRFTSRNDRTDLAQIREKKI